MVSTESDKYLKYVTFVTLQRSCIEKPCPDGNVQRNFIQAINFPVAADVIISRFTFTPKVSLIFVKV